MSLLSNDNNNDLFRFSGSVGRFGDNDRADVIKAQALLANAGYYDLPMPGVPTGWPGGELSRAVQTFQKDHGLDPDGILLPLRPDGVSAAGEGETLQALNEKLGERLQKYAAPTPDDVDRFYDERAQRGRDSDTEPDTEIVTRSAQGEDDRPVGVKPILPASTPGIAISDADPAGPPVLNAGQQEAYAGPIIQGAVRAAPHVSKFMRGLGLLGPAITLPLSGDQKPEASADHDAARIPDPAQPEEDRQQTDFAQPRRGRIVIAEDGRELHVPPLGQWADKLNADDRQLAETFNEAFAAEMELRTGGSRGNALTQEGVNIAIKACVEAANELFPGAEVEHVFGGNRGGDANEKAKAEEHLRNYDDEGNPVRTGSRRPDFTIAIVRGVVEMVRGNTFDSDGSGTPTDREAKARDSIQEMSPDEKLAMFEKRNPNMTAAEFEENAKKICRSVMEEVRADWERRGELDKPKTATLKDYLGPANARRAKILQERKNPR